MRGGLILVGICVIALGCFWVFGSGGSDARPVEVATEESVEETVPDAETGTVTGTGSRSDEESDRVEVEVAVPAGSRSIVGRAIGPDGEPLAETGAPLTFRYRAGGRVRATVKTDAKGRFLLPVDDRLVVGGRLSIRDEIGGVMVGAEVDVPAAQSLQVDAGTLRMTALVMVARGRVIDDLMRPIAGARVAARADQSHVSPVSPNRDVETALLEANVAERSVRLEKSLVALRERAEALQAVDRAKVARALEQELAAAQAAMEAAVTQRLLAVRGGGSESSPVFAPNLLRNHVWHVDGAVHDPHPQLAQAETRADGTFELYAVQASLPIRLDASADGHRDVAQPLPGLGSWVELTLERTAGTYGTAIAPDWMPAHALEFDLVRDGKSVGKVRGNGVGSRTDFDFEDLDPGTYQLVVRVRTLPDALRTIGPIELRPGPAEHQPQLHDIDLTRSVYRYQLRAYDDAGRPLTDIPSPLLAKVGNRYVGFPWRGNSVEIFAAQPNIPVILLNAGYRAEEVRVDAGIRDLVFHALHPVEVFLPGLREMCGPDRKVRVSMILEGSTGLPQGLQAVHLRSGESRGYNRWHLSKSGGAWLGATDVVRVPLIRNGKYEIVVRLHQEGVGGDASIAVGTHEVVLDDVVPHRVTIELDRDSIQKGLASLRQRAGG